MSAGQITWAESTGALKDFEYSAEDECIYGKLQNIRDLVNYEADSAKDLKVEFEAAVDDYLETCEELGKEADKPYKGVFNVRTVPALHRDLDQLAARMDVSLNKVVTEALTVIRDMVKDLPPGVFSAPCWAKNPFFP